MIKTILLAILYSTVSFAAIKNECVPRFSQLSMLPMTFDEAMDHMGIATLEGIDHETFQRRYYDELKRVREEFGAEIQKELIEDLDQAYFILARSMENSVFKDFMAKNRNKKIVLLRSEINEALTAQKFSNYSKANLIFVGNIITLKLYFYLKKKRLNVFLKSADGQIFNGRNHLPILSESLILEFVPKETSINPLEKFIRRVKKMYRVNQVTLNAADILNKNNGNAFFRVEDNTKRIEIGLSFILKSIDNLHRYKKSPRPGAHYIFKHEISHALLFHATRNGKQHFFSPRFYDPANKLTEFENFYNTHMSLEELFNFSHHPKWILDGIKNYPDLTQTEIYEALNAITHESQNLFVIAESVRKLAESFKDHKNIDLNKIIFLQDHQVLQVTNKDNISVFLPYLSEEQIAQMIEFQAAYAVKRESISPEDFEFTKSITRYFEQLYNLSGWVMMYSHYMKLSVKTNGAVIASKSSTAEHTKRAFDRLYTYSKFLTHIVNQDSQDYAADAVDQQALDLMYIRMQNDDQLDELFPTSF